MLLALLFSTLSTLAPAALDQPVRPPDPDILSVQFTNGDLARVRVLGLEQRHVKLRQIVLNGSMEVRHRLDEFEPSSSFKIELALRNPRTADEYIAMAKRAAALNLSREAGNQVAAAVLRLEGMPDSEPKIRELRVWSARALEGWFTDATERRDLTAAMRYLKLISTRYSDLRSENELEQLALSVEKLERDRAANRRAAREARLDKRTLATIQRRLKPILADVERGDELYRKAISKSGQMTQSAKLAASAIDAYTEAWRLSMDLQKRHPDEASLAIELESIANHLHDHAILAALHSASLLAVRGNYAGAMERVRWVLAIDPTHAEALEMQRTITVAGAAASSGWGVGWGTADLR